MVSGRRMASMVSSCYTIIAERQFSPDDPIMSVKELIIHLVQMVLGVLLIRSSSQRELILNRSGTCPLSNQKFCRSAFLILRLVLIIGGLGSPRVAWYITSPHHGRFFN